MNQERIYQVLLGPHISEKSTIASDTNNQYAFRVTRDATKREVKQAVEQLFKVKVAGVQMLNVKGKRKLNRYGVARNADWKKAYVRLEAGHDIEFAVMD